MLRQLLTQSAFVSWVTGTIAWLVFLHSTGWNHPLLHRLESRLPNFGVNNGDVITLLFLFIFAHFPPVTFVVYLCVYLKNWRMIIIGVSACIESVVWFAFSTAFIQSGTKEAVAIALIGGLVSASTLNKASAEMGAAEAKRAKCQDETGLE